MSNKQELNQWAMFLHLSLLAGIVVPGAGLVAPIVIWQVKKDALPGLDVHGKIALNWIISSIIYLAISGLLVLVVIGLPLLLAVGICTMVFPVIGAIKASSGEVWHYPLTIKFIK